MKILITGASGFIGKSLAEHLSGKGHDLILLSRETPKASLPKALHIQIDDLATAKWSEILPSVDAVVHLASRVHVMKENSKIALEKYRAVNVAGTKRLAEACVKHGIGRFIFMSSIKVNGEQTIANSFSEADVPAPRDPYGQSKWEAELSLLSLADRTPLQVVILRPPLVYGPGVKANFLNLMSAIDKNIPLPVGALSKNRRSMIFVGNLVAAVDKILNEPNLKKEIFLVSDLESPSTFILAQKLQGLLKSRSFLIPVPSYLLERLASFLGQKQKIQRLTGSLEIDSNKIRKNLQWDPPWTMDDGFRKTVEWYKASRTSKDL